LISFVEVVLKVILITGCSSGFGLLTAARLSAVGFTVYASMRNLSKQEDLLKEVKRRGGHIRLLQLDVTENKTIKMAIQRIKEEVNRLDVLINNAGYGIGGFFEDLSEQEIREQMETNFFGVQKVTRYALPLMRKTAADFSGNGGVKIINISSGQGRFPTPGLGAYAASKFALEGFSESLHFELIPFGISVVLVEPGSYRTKIFFDNVRKAVGADDPGSPYINYTNIFEERVRQMLKSPRGMGNPEEVAVVIEKIVNNPHPRLRYLIGRRTRFRVFLRAALPFKWFAYLVKRNLFRRREDPA